MRRAGKVVAEVLDIIGDTVRPGISTGELDRLAEEHIRSCGAVAVFKNYRPDRSMTPFPGTVCASVNEEIIHGFPSFDRILQEGDIISIDVGALLDGYVGDAACTYPVGEISPQRAELLRVTETSLDRAIAAAVRGATIGDIGHAVQSYAEGLGYGVIRDFTGHGVGKKLHEAPQVPNYGRPGRGVTLQRGMTIAIEPMIASGTYAIKIGRNGWTVCTADGSDAAHFERSVAVTDDGPEILTPWISRMDR